MRYFKHLALWSVGGLLVVGLAGALVGAFVGVLAAWATIAVSTASQAEVAYVGAYYGAILGAYSGAICGFVALLCLAIPRPPLQGKGWARLRKALAVVGGFVLGGTPVLVLGFAVLAFGLTRLMARPSRLDEITWWILCAHFLFVAFPALVGAIAASRALKRFETLAVSP